jgi:hypothetical protein
MNEMMNERSKTYDGSYDDFIHSNVQSDTLLKDYILPTWRTAP